MSQYLVFYKKNDNEERRIESVLADDKPQLLHKLGDKKLLHKVEAIYYVELVEFDIAYYQNEEDSNPS